MIATANLLARFCKVSINTKGPCRWYGGLLLGYKGFNPLMTPNEIRPIHTETREKSRKGAPKALTKVATVTIWAFAKTNLCGQSGKRKEQGKSTQFSPHQPALVTTFDREEGIGLSDRRERERAQEREIDGERRGNERYCCNRSLLYIHRERERETETLLASPAPLRCGSFHR